MNEYQLAIGETTTGGKRELHSQAGMIDAPELYRLILERAKTAREAIRIADQLTKQSGYNDWGECFTFADPSEVWHFEILGPGPGKVGAVWAAVRLPDDEIGVSANAHRIRHIDIEDINDYPARVAVNRQDKISRLTRSKGDGVTFEGVHAVPAGPEKDIGSKRAGVFDSREVPFSVLQQVQGSRHIQSTLALIVDVPPRCTNLISIGTTHDHMPQYERISFFAHDFFPVGVKQRCAARYGCS
jgi:dipeptidase